MYSLNNVYELLHFAKSHIIYKWLAAESELYTESEMSDKIWADSADS